MLTTTVPEFSARSDLRTALASECANAGPDESRSKALRLGVSGLNAAEIGVLQSILSVLEQRTARPWRLSDEPTVELHLHTREAGPESRVAEVVGLLLREGDAPLIPDQLAITLPLRVMSVFDALSAAQDRLCQHRLSEPVPDDTSQHATDDGKALASALARLAERRLEQKLRIRIVGHGTLYLCPSERLYCVDFPRERLGAALDQHRYVITALLHDSQELTAQLPFAGPIDEVLWRIGLLTVWERTDKERLRFRLRRWPDLARLPHRAEHIQMCALLAARPMGLTDLAAAAGASLSEATHLLHACELCGLLQPVEPEDVAPSPAATVPAHGLGGLFNRLRRKLGF